ncbi:50S ribosomal protein L31 [Streptomyces sp. SID9124]|nr:50S ribosomal protein L31 [Streptomyces sp. SID9124]NED13047.1 hypothetical protein [Streptomyces sp. SID9124]
MKPGIHPAYRPVVFRDRAGDFAITAGRVERFERRYGKGGGRR